MQDLAAGALMAALGALAAIHLYWAAGGAKGKSVTVPTQNGRPLFEPGRLAALAVSVLLLAAAVIVFARVRWGIWGLAGMFLLRAIGDFRYAGFFKRVRDTEFARWDTWFYSPLCLALSILAACLLK